MRSILPGRAKHFHQSRYRSKKPSSRANIDRSSPTVSNQDHQHHLLSTKGRMPVCGGGKPAPREGVSWLHKASTSGQRLITTDSAVLRIKTIIGVSGQPPPAKVMQVLHKPLVGGRTLRVCASAATSCAKPRGEPVSSQDKL